MRSLTASGLREALAVVRDGGFDAVVIDVYDPSAGIVDLALGMNALPDAPPIILLSDSPAAPWISVRIGAATFVPKPCDPEEVVAASRAPDCGGCARCRSSMTSRRCGCATYHDGGTALAVR